MGKKVCEVCDKVIESRWNVRFEDDTIHCKECYQTEEAAKLIREKTQKKAANYSQSESNHDTKLESKPDSPKSNSSSVEKPSLPSIISFEQSSLPSIITLVGWIIFALSVLMFIISFVKTSSLLLALPSLIFAVIQLLFFLAIAKVLSLLEVIAMNTKSK